jgi:hypothetical protein
MEPLLQRDYSPSLVRVAVAAASTQGNFDTVGAADAEGLSLGVLPWSSSKEENISLTRLLHQLRETEPGFFEAYLEKPGFSLAYTEKMDNPSILLWRGEELSNRLLRQEDVRAETAFYLWNAAQLIPMQAMQIEMLANLWQELLEEFERRGPYDLERLITSELSAATALNHYITQPRSFGKLLDGYQPPGQSKVAAKVDSADADFLEHMRKSQIGTRQSPIWAAHEKVLKRLVKAGLLSTDPGSFQPSKRSRR